MHWCTAVGTTLLACLGLASCDSAPETLATRVFLITRANIAFENSDDGVAGLDLDGVTSDVSMPALEGGCAHTDQIGLAGEPGVDSQLVQLGGAIALFGFGDINATLQQTINDGGLSILLELDDVQSFAEDRHVSMRAFRGEGPFALGTDGLAEPGQSFDLMPGFPSAAPSAKSSR